MKFKVFFDSNQLFNRNGPLGEPFDNSVKELYEFLSKYEVLDRVAICIPEIVVKERIQTKIEDIDQQIETANSRIASLKTIGYEIDVIKKLSKATHKKRLVQRAKAYIKEYGIYEVKNGSVDIKGLIEKSIAKIRPFNDKGVGLKDTLIFLSMIEDAQKCKTETVYIFCTNNTSQFGDDVVKQFKDSTRRDMVIVKNVEEVKEKMDELIPLELHLEERNNAIKELVMKKTGTITKELNESLFIPSTAIDIHRAMFGPSSSEKFSVGVRNAYEDSYVTDTWGQEQAERIHGYDFRDITFLNIDEQDKNQFEVDVNILTDIVYEDKNSGKVDRDDSLRVRSVFAEPTVAYYRPVTSYGFDEGLYQNRHRTNARNFSVSLVCDLDDQTVKVSAVY